MAMTGTRITTMTIEQPVTKKVSILLAVLAIAGCVKQEEGEAVTTNSNFKLERLFTHDGCTVYRFYDARYRYYSDCRGAAAWSESCGKNCTSDQSVETVR
jgi:hypothetical protein